MNVLLNKQRKNLTRSHSSAAEMCLHFQLGLASDRHEPFVRTFHAGCQINWLARWSIVSRVSAHVFGASRRELGDACWKYTRMRNRPGADICASSNRMWRESQIFAVIRGEREQLRSFSVWTTGEVVAHGMQRCVPKHMYVLKQITYRNRWAVQTHTHLPT